MTGERATLEKTHVGRLARALKEPYSGVEVARIDDFSLSVFLCEGTIAWHRHVDEDEMFLVYSGAMTIESELGPVFLRAGEVTVIPKGVRHRSASPIRTEVLLFQPYLFADRRNGDRRPYYALDGEGGLSRVNLYTMAMNVAERFVPEHVISIGEFDLRLAVCEGDSDERTDDRRAVLLLVQQGELRLTAGSGGTDLFVGDVVVIPRGTPWAVSAPKRALLLEFLRHQ